MHAANGITESFLSLCRAGQSECSRTGRVGWCSLLVWAGWVAWFENALLVYSHEQLSSASAVLASRMHISETCHSAHFVHYSRHAENTIVLILSVFRVLFQQLFYFNTMRMLTTRSPAMKIAFCLFCMNPLGTLRFHYHIHPVSIQWRIVLLAFPLCHFNRPFFSTHSDRQRINKTTDCNKFNVNSVNSR